MHLGDFVFIFHFNYNKNLFHIRLFLVHFVLTVFTDVCMLLILDDLWKQLLEEVGAECNLRHLGFQDCPNGSKLELPPVLLGQLGSDADKPTLLVYGHLDVQPALKVVS